jgi:pyruvate kinase
MARFRPESQLLGLAPDARTARALALTWGVTPLHVGTYGSTDEMVRFAIERALESGSVDHGDTVLVLAGAPDARPARTAREDPDLPATDVLRILRVD